MSCCGNGRREYARASGLSSTNSRHGHITKTPALRDVQLDAARHFVLTGDRSMVVVGPTTGQRYIFRVNAEAQPVAGSDAAGMRTVPGLQEVAMEIPARSKS